MRETACLISAFSRKASVVIFGSNRNYDLARKVLAEPKDPRFEKSCRGAMKL
jgi:hypothetical protein